MPRTPYDYQPILTFIRAYTLDNGYPPSLREIGAGCHLTRTAVHYHVDNMCDLGILSKKPRSPRSITVNKSV